MSRLVLIDGNSIMNRAFYGIMSSKMLQTADGTYTNAVYGFLAIMFKVMEDLKPEYMAVAFDLKAPTFRHLEYDAYKAGRKSMPPELAMQMPLLKDVLRALNIEILEMEGYEADDIIGTVARISEEAGINPYIITGDKDTGSTSEFPVSINAVTSTNFVLVPVVPSPKFPYPLYPATHKLLLLSIAKLEYLPASIFIIFSNDCTKTGKLLFAVSPNPNCP